MTPTPQELDALIEKLEELHLDDSVRWEIGGTLATGTVLSKAAAAMRSLRAVNARLTDWQPEGNILDLIRRAEVAEERIKELEDMLHIRQGRRVWVKS
jgi:hypothetical protein